MHQSRKEQGLERSAKILLNPDLREARLIAEIDSNMEVAEEWDGRPLPSRRAGFGE
ncbi:hypothetical protein I6N90_04750 [Paenibacillus sp. GSMTC-2017]|uniref:hypothetical protein n=1 Tax=Paenibacillus sp. GSMTC-2017 TaxID=2794350 RepID=UPI0018D9A9AF|nr:hypothetical protein [Paenibacillus sp. GSMTC-2017]MBH5317117.1 hypothetical protein [Paenibacillus sp. GSMTC-2017]